MFKLLTAITLGLVTITPLHATPGDSCYSIQNPDDLLLVVKSRLKRHFTTSSTSSQPIRRHSSRQLAVVPLNHGRSVAHLPAQRVKVSAVEEQL